MLTPSDRELLVELINNLRTFNAEQKAFNAEQEAFNSSVLEDLTLLNTKFDTLQGVVINVQKDVKRIQGDVGHLRGFALEQYVNSHIKDILTAHGYNLLKVVGRTTREAFYNRASSEEQLDDINDSDRTSFFRADLTLLVERIRSEEINYLAVEISNSLKEIDISRAKRNADYFTRFTGIQAVAVVIGPDIHSEIRKIAEESGVLYHVVDSNFLHNGR